ncbi:ATP synthase subunit I [Amnimonas aquatica]|uniref:F0F1 ATP synthase subunit I n=1 Tax=Amnimonas aquatica TaxID=2094561 RepID=A0A2P6AUV7_9GAMM|nr:ATP synthase subunit I [Amnimonas aquatica]PQA51095.1 F0F1 ATP synthase subunit I [Amnimonas aquatica]
MTVSKPQPLVDVQPAVQQLKWQLRLLALLFLIALLSAGTHAGLSALAGAGIAVIGQAYFVFRAFRHAGATSAQHIVQDFYRGAAGKFVLTALLFAAVFAGYKAVEPGWLFASFVLEQLVAWIVPLTSRRTQR